MPISFYAFTCATIAYRIGGGGDDGWCRCNIQKTEITGKLELCAVFYVPEISLLPQSKIVILVWLK